MRIRALMLGSVFVTLAASTCDILPGGSGAGGAGGNPLAGADPMEEARAAALAYDLTGLVNQASDPSGMDDSATQAAMVSNAPTALSDVSDWLASTDPSQLSTDYSGYECADKLSCPYKGTCVNGSYPAHLCWVDECGSATCQNCPGKFKDWVGNLVFKSWCSYLCVEPVAYGKTVAVGIIGVTSWGSTLPAGGPYCFDP